jgi:thiol-disulfide isomerase/thioredoxin
LSWAGYLFLAVAALMIAPALWVKLASGRIRGKPIAELASVFPDLAGYRGRAVVYCYSAHCGPCRRLAPAVEALAGHRPRLYPLDLGTHTEAARALGIHATPTSLMIENGQVVKVILGDPLKAIETFLVDQRPAAG